MTASDRFGAECGASRIVLLAASGMQDRQIAAKLKNCAGERRALAEPVFDGGFAALDRDAPRSRWRLHRQTQRQPQALRLDRQSFRHPRKGQARPFEGGKVSGERRRPLTVEQSSPDLIGFETAWYDLRPKTGGRGFTIVASSAETSIKGKVESQPAPARNYFQFAPEMGFYRLFYKADQSEVLAAAAHARRCPPIWKPAIGRADLSVWRFRAVSESILICLVDVNGSPVGGWGIGSNLRALLRTMRQSEDKALPTLAITRFWEGKTHCAGIRPLATGRTQSGIDR